jgi:hypothetical protein
MRKQNKIEDSPKYVYLEKLYFIPRCLQLLQLLQIAGEVNYHPVDSFSIGGAPYLHELL